MRNLWFSCVLLLLGCAGAPPPPEPVPITAAIVAAADLNPDVNGRASPVVVRVYQLRSPGAFDKADFFTLYRDAASVLGPDVVVSDEIQVQPGENGAYKTEIDPQARYLGVIAAFRDIGKATWRAGVALPEAEQAEFFRTHKLSITLGALSVSAAAGKP